MIEYVSIPEERMKLLRVDRRWERKLKKFIDVDIHLSDVVEIENPDPLVVIRIKLIFQAFGRGFDFEDALGLLDEEYALEIIDISDYVKSKNRITTLKGRVIGTKGKAKNIIANQTETKISIYGKTVAVIGRFENVAKAKDTIKIILSGRKHSTAFRFLE